MDAKEIDERTTVEADSAVGLIAVTASSGDPEQAARVANGVTQAYQEQANEAIAERLDTVDNLVTSGQIELAEEVDRLRRVVASNPDDAEARRRLDALFSQLSAIQNRIGETAADTAVFGSGIEGIERAIVPDGPASPRPLRNAAVLGVVGLAVAIGAVYWRALRLYLSSTDPVALLGAPLLARIPNFKRLLASREHTALFDIEAVEAYQFLLSSFEYAIDQMGAKSILVTSPSPGDGKSLTSLQLARALSVQGRDVILVDADIRGRGLTLLLNAEEYIGLVSLAESDNDVDVNDVIRRFRISQNVQLSMVPTGEPPAHPTGLLATPAYRQAISRLSEQSELTIVDTGSLLTVADAAAVATQVDGILVVLDDHTPETDLVKLRDRLRLVATPLIGLVVNRVNDEQSAALYTSEQRAAFRPTDLVHRSRDSAGRSPSFSEAGRTGQRTG